MNIRIIYCFLILFCAKSFAQIASLAPYAFTSSSVDRSTVGANHYTYSIGQPVVTMHTTTQTSPKTIYVTQGYQQSANGAFSGPTIVKITAEQFSSCDSTIKKVLAIATVTGGTPPLTYSWKDKTTNNDSVYYTTTGSYDLHVTDATGQHDSLSFTISKDPNPCDLVFYKGVTVNGDGHNDFWYIKGIENYSTNEIKIFNVWGSLIWSGKGYDNRSVIWTGDNESGSAMPAGTYYYIAELPGALYKGWIELIR